jgi:hypothetical protein
MSVDDIHELFLVAGYWMSVLMASLKKDQWQGATSTLFRATTMEKLGEYLCSSVMLELGS